MQIEGKQNTVSTMEIKRKKEIKDIMHYKLVVGVPMSFGVMGDKDKETK